MQEQYVSNEKCESKCILPDDNGFLRYSNIPIDPKRDSKKIREIFTTLMASQGENVSDKAEKLIAANIVYRDLGSLTHQDLELMGFTKTQQRNELLEFFALLPNQDPSLKQIYQMTQASTYNRQIINNASVHLDSMRTALLAATYKLQIMLPEDVIVGEKSFASRFVVEALNELCSVTDDIDKAILEVDSIIRRKPQSTGHSFNKKAKGSIFDHFYFTACLILGSLTSIGALLSFCFFKYKN